jgi:ADP-ribose pyrophosphatase YjhB (NUDIX family)
MRAGAVEIGSASLKPSFTRRVPPDDADDVPRRVCDHCGFVDYVNPRIVVGTVCARDGRVLLCRRAIEPRKGYWTIPAGFLEENETPEQGAERETQEEAGALVRPEALLAVYSVPRISQVHLFFRAALLSPNVSPGVESLEVAFFAWADIPWEELAFPSVRMALEAWRATLESDDFQPHRETG